MNIVCTGTLNNYSRSEMKTIIINNGAEFMSNITQKTTLVICGDNPGSKKEKALKLGIKIITEKEFMQLLK